MWLETKTVLPSRPSRRISSRTSTMPAGSSPFAGSSRIRTSGSLRSAPAIPRRCFIPSEYVLTWSSARSARPTSSRARAMRARPIPEIFPSSSRLRRPENRGYIVGLSTIEPTRPITRCSPAGSCPSRRQRPPVGRTRPRRQRIVVVLPAPFGPRNPNTPPCGTARSRPSTATVLRPRTRRYSLRSPSTSMTGSIRQPYVAPRARDTGAGTTAQRGQHPGHALQGRG